MANPDQIVDQIRDEDHYNPTSPDYNAATPPQLVPPLRIKLPKQPVDPRLPSDPRRSILTPNEQLIERVNLEMNNIRDTILAKRRIVLEPPPVPPNLPIRREVIFC